MGYELVKLRTQLARGRATLNDKMDSASKGHNLQGYRKAKGLLQEFDNMPVSVVLHDVTGSTNDDPAAHELAKVLTEYGAFPFVFGDTTFREPALAQDNDLMRGRIDGGGNGSESPFLSLAFALAALGRPLPNLDPKQICEIALEQNFDQQDIAHIRGMGNVLTLDRNHVVSVGEPVKIHEDLTLKNALETFAPALLALTSSTDPYTQMCLEHVRNGVDVNLIIMTDEFPGAPISYQLTQLLKKGMPGNEFTTFLEKYHKTIRLSSNYWTDGLGADLAKLNVHPHFITPWENRYRRGQLDYEKEFGLDKVGYVYSELARVLGGTYTPLGSNLRDVNIENLFKLRPLQSIVDNANLQMKLLTVDTP